MEIQAVWSELLKHGGAVNVKSHLKKGQSSFVEMVPTSGNEEQFAMINILAALVEQMKKMDPKKPELVLLHTLNRNFVVADTIPALSDGGPVVALNPKEMQTAEFESVAKGLNQKYARDPPRKDALVAVLAASKQKPMNTEDIFKIYEFMSEEIKLVVTQWQQLVQLLVQAQQLRKEFAESAGTKWYEYPKANLFNLAQVIYDGTAVGTDGRLKMREPGGAMTDEAAALIEIAKEFWVAFFRAGVEPKIRDKDQALVAQLLRNVGAMYVRTSTHGATSQTAELVDAEAHRFIIQKLRASPMMRADRARMAAVERIAYADASGRKPTPAELAEIFETLGKAIEVTPDMLRAVFEQMIVQIRSMPRRPQQMAGMQKLFASGNVNPAEAIRVLNRAIAQKPSESVTALDLFVNFILAMHATKQDAELREQCQRLTMEAMRQAAQIHKTGPTTDLSKAHRVVLTKLSKEPEIRSDKKKTQAVEALVQAQIAGKSPTSNNLLEIFRELGRGLQMTPEMLRLILEHMCTQMKSLTPNERVELQKRFRQSPSISPTDFVEEAAKARQEANDLASQAQVVGAFQILPEGHPAMAAARVPLPTQSRELGMRAGPASVEWHRYKALGTAPPETEVARIVLVQSQLADVKNFEDEETQKTLMKEAADVTFRSLLQPTVMDKYTESLKGDKAAMSALHGLSKAANMDDAQLEKNVDQLLNTLTIDRKQLRGVLQQLVKDRLMTNDEAKLIERSCEESNAGGGKMKLSELQAMLRAKKGNR